MGRHTLKTWSATQKKVTLSSGEDQLVAMVKMSCEMIGMTQLASEWGLAMKGNVFAGSSVALGIAERRGSGKMRHVKIGTLWIQEKNQTGELQYTKVQGDNNPADLMTNNVNRRTLDKMAAPDHSSNAFALAQVLFCHPKSLSVCHGSRAMGKRTDELEGRLAASNDTLSGVVIQFNRNKQKFKDETEFEFAQQKLVLHEVVEGARKEFEGLRQAIHGLHVETNTVTNLQQRVVHLESNSPGAYTNKGHLPHKSMVPKNFTDKADEWRSSK